jgi:hypothetical protein
MKCFWWLISKSAAGKLTEMPTLVLLWVWVCAYLNCAGWALSALHQLNARGYVVALALGFAALVIWRIKTSARFLPEVRWRKTLRRFRRPFPLAFLILSTLAFLGGAIYAPTNYDALAYRLPRVLHWLAAGHWHWIHTIFERVNTRACGIEWVSAPLIVLLKTDRLLFLINTVSFLLLPGLIFSVFTRLGVRRRVAWHWMWLVPTGYGFVLQAGSIGNDLFGAVSVLAAMHFALRTKNSQLPGDFFTAIVAAGMMTACKLSNLTLMLPWVLAFLPSARLALRWPARTAAVCLLALVASVLPTALENFKFSGDWTGMAAEQPGMVRTPLFKTGVNIVQGALQNFVPPVFPPADKWNRMMDRELPPTLAARLNRTMEGPQCRFHLDVMQIEENAGLGSGLSVLLAVSIVAAFFARGGISGGGSLWLACVRWSPFISLLALLAQSNLYPLARLLVPYYGLLLPPLLVLAGHETVVRKRWWRLAAFAVFLMAAGLLVISPPRPLFPVRTILGKIAAQTPESKMLARANEVYSVYGHRNDAFASARDRLPPGLAVLGMVTFDDPETSLWRPFGSRHIEHVIPQDTAADLKARGVEYILVKPEVFGGWFDGTPDDWFQRMNAEVVQKIPLNLRASDGVRDWYLIQLQ